CPFSSFKSVMTTFAPSSINFLAWVAPIPCAAPVIIATLPSKRPIKMSSLKVKYRNEYGYLNMKKVRDLNYELSISYIVNTRLSQFISFEMEVYCRKVWLTCELFL